MTYVIRTVTVYCSSSSELAQHYYDAGAELGCAIASNGWKLVYGGNAIGLMKTVADAVRAAGGKVIGITPQFFCNKGLEDRLCDELVITNSMRDRKALLEERGDAYIALPGGLGTFEEIFEIIVGKQLAYHNKPIVFLNTAGYWNPMIAMIQSAIEQKFIKPKARNLYFIAATVSQAVDYLRSYIPPALKADKWFAKGVAPATE